MSLAAGLNPPPSISIVVPSYNQGEFLKETLESILNQQYPNLELIVIDGGSSDDSVTVLKSHDASIDYWVSEPDRGQSHAINKGFEKATGDIIAWLNSDDLYEPGALQAVMEAFQKHQDIGFVHGQARIFGVGQEELIQGADMSKGIATYLSGMASPQPSYFFRRSLLEHVGLLREDLDFGMDYDFFLRLALATEGYYLNEPILAGYRIHGDSKTTQSKARFAEEWASIFSTLLRSNGFEQGIHLMKTLELYHPLETQYDASAVDPQIMQDATGLALLHIATFYNLGGEKKRSLRILSEIKARFPDIYRHKELKWLHFKIALKQRLTFK